MLLILPRPTHFAGAAEVTNGKEIAMTHIPGPLDAGELASEAKDNARLIAAAPDLLAALKALYTAVELRANREGGDFGEDIGPAAEIAAQAIAKAK